MKKITFSAIAIFSIVIISACTKQAESNFSFDISKQLYANNIKKDIGTAD